VSASHFTRTACKYQGRYLLVGERQDKSVSFLVQAWSIKIGTLKNTGEGSLGLKEQKINKLLVNASDQNKIKNHRKCRLIHLSYLSYMHTKIMVE
jgi:hypothetical protein